MGVGRLLLDFDRTAALGQGGGDVVQPQAQVVTAMARGSQGPAATSQSASRRGSGVPSVVS